MLLCFVVLVVIVWTVEQCFCAKIFCLACFQLVCWQPLSHVFSHTVNRHLAFSLFLALDLLSGQRLDWILFEVFCHRNQQLFPLEDLVHCKPITKLYILLRNIVHQTELCKWITHQYFVDQELFLIAQNVKWLFFFCYVFRLQMLNLSNHVSLFNKVFDFLELF